MFAGSQPAHAHHAIKRQCPLESGFGGRIYETLIHRNVAADWDSSPHSRLTRITLLPESISSRTVTVEGTVKQFKWNNPHAYIDLEVANGKGGIDLWSLEMTSPAIPRSGRLEIHNAQIRRQGKVAARPFKNGDPGGIFVSVALPDGKTLTQQAAPAAPAPAAPASK